MCFTSALDGGVCSASRSSRFTVRESAPFTHWAEARLGCAAGVDTGDDKDFLGLPGILISLSSSMYPDQHTD